jgi:hypothetical protein
MDYRTRRIHVDRNIPPPRSAGPAPERYSSRQSSSYRRRAPRRSQSLPRLYASLPPRINSSARRYPSTRTPRISISSTISDSDDSLDSLDSFVFEEEDEPSSEEPEEESEEEELSDGKEEIGDETGEIQRRWDRLSVTAPSNNSHILPPRSNHGSNSNWLNVHHPMHSVSAPTSPTYESLTRSPISPSPTTLSQSRLGSPPRGPPRPPRIMIGSDGERDSDESSSDGMPYFSRVFH